MNISEEKAQEARKTVRAVERRGMLRRKRKTIGEEIRERGYEDERQVFDEILISIIGVSILYTVQVGYLGEQGGDYGEFTWFADKQQDELLINTATTMPHDSRYHSRRRPRLSDDCSHPQ